ncbi:hypothetical protein Bca101_087934 [Brassica carinata]
MSQDWRAGEYCSSELSVDCLRVSYRTWAAWALDVMIVGGPMDPGDRGRDLFHAPSLSVRGPLSPVDEVFQHFHETCNHIHPLERPGLEVSYLAKCLHPASARSPLFEIRQMYPLRRFPWSTRAPLVYPRDHWLISNKVLGDLVYVLWESLGFLE